MRKALFTSLVLLTLLALVTGTVSAAPLADGVITLVDVRNDSGGNVIFIFNVSGDFARHKMNGTVDVQGVDARYGLHCSLVSKDTIQCTTSRKTAGRNVVVYLDGFIFWTFVPEANGPAAAASTQYCYGVYEIGGDPKTESFSWMEFDTHCQDIPANEGDELELDQSFFEFWNESPACWVDPVSGDGYFAQCPL